MDINLTGKTAVIGGGSQGIGHAIALEMAEAGARCILLARDKAELKKAVSGLPVPQQQKHLSFAVDFSDRDELEATIEKINADHEIQILINNTGGPKPGLIFEEKPEKFEQAFQQHIVANQLLTQAFVPAMREAGYGRIINVISTSVRTPIANLGVSNTIRAAVASWAKTLAGELGQYGITVNSILPGYTDTGRLKALIDTNAAKQYISSDELASKMQQQIPLRRFGRPEEIGAVAAFLASPAASYVTGVSIPVDGGNTPTI